MKLNIAQISGIFILAVSQQLIAQAPIAYEVSFANAVHHEAAIEATFTDIDTDVLELRMSRSSPGRYALHEYAKNVYSVHAEDRNGNSLEVTRPSPYQWNIQNHGGYVKLSYTLFADRADGTYSQIDATHAHLNIPATFMWARNLETRPIQLEFKDFDPDWKVATQLVPSSDENTFTAPDFQYFMDSPVEISDFSLREFPVASNGKTYTIKLAVHHDAEESNVDQFAQMAEAVVNEHIAVFGEAPDFDYGSYTFIADYLPQVNGDGMEHRNSTILSAPLSLDGNESRALGTLSHEFFHAWNMERIRSQALQPFDFERANMSAELWFGEGFTQYYGELLLHRSGMRTEQQYINTVKNLVNAITFSRGRQFFSPTEMSMKAAFVDAATALDPTAFRNTHLSYYTYGAALALALDLTLRADYQLELDDYMQYMWNNFGKKEVYYSVEDLQASLAALTRDAEFAQDFFQRYVYSNELPDYQNLLLNAGLTLSSESLEDATLGRVALNFEDGRATLVSDTLIDSPLYTAGLDRGDQISKIGRYRIRSERNWDRMMGRIEPGDVLSIEYSQRGISKIGEVIVAADKTLSVLEIEGDGGEFSEEQTVFRRNWLESKVD